MQIENIKDLFQIAFWMVAMVLAVFTYKNAKKAIFGSVNTEYQKRAFEGLDRISKKLFLDSDLKFGRGFLLYDFPMQRQYEELKDQYLSNTDHVEKHGLDDTEFSNPMEWKVLHNLKDEIDTDIFLPDEVRVPLVNLLDDRSKAAFDSHVEAYSRYVEFLNNNKVYDDLKTGDFSLDLENYYIEALDKRGFGVDKVYEWNLTIYKLMSGYVGKYHNSLKS